MKKYYFFLIFVFYFSTTYSQSNQGKVEYTASFDLTELVLKMDSAKFIDPVLEEKLTQTLYANQDVKFELRFNEDEALFNCISDLYTKPGALRVMNQTALYSRAKNTYFSTENETLKINPLFENQLIIEPTVLWKFTEERKKIGAYNCYKATTIQELDSRYGLIKRPVEAWYTPEIPTSFGVQNFNGLPGLILELHIQNKLLFKATKIDLTPQNPILLEKPKGTKITTEEYIEILKGARG